MKPPMVTVGVDVGSVSTKVVVLGDSGVLSRAQGRSGACGVASDCLERALREAQASPKDIRVIISTGMGKSKVSEAARQETEIACDARGAWHLFGQLGMVVDLGAETTRAIRYDSAGNAADFALNDKCAAGSGIFLEAMAKALRTPIEQMGDLSLRSTQALEITSMCVVFAESEVITQVHGRRMPMEDIISGIHKSVATRVCALMSRVGFDGTAVAVGGLARNVGLVKWLEDLAGVRILVPEQPEFVGAIGAALLAREER